MNENSSISELWEAIRTHPDNKCNDLHVESLYGCTDAAVKATMCDWKGEDVEWIEGKDIQEALWNLWIHISSEEV